ncbi:MAG: PDZ domain-containing protein [Gemmataceae bacterium]
MRYELWVSLLLVGLMPSPLWSQQETRLLRFPTIHKDKIVFTYAGNLYTVNVEGGVARRLTSHVGFEMFARFSPDGKTIAFTGQYDGNTEVYVMPAEGGVPKRLTYTATLERDDISDRMGPNNIVMGWTNDGSNILFRSRMNEPNSFLGQLYLVSKDGGLPKQLPLPRGGFGSFSPGDGQFAYNRVFREFRTWKRYRGGMADEIWVHDFKTKNTTKITDNEGQDIIPMWHGKKIYYLSDDNKAKRFNLYVYDTETKKTAELTQFTDFDIKFPSLGPDAIVFEHAGYIHRFDLATQKAKKVSIRVLEDFASSRPKRHSVAKEIVSYEISNDGNRALFWARGDLFTVPAKKGQTRNLTATPGVHDRDPKWSPDGKHVAYISDATGEDEIYIIPADGSGTTTQITNNGDTYKYALSWAPDSGKILWADKKLRLQYVDVKTKKVTLVDQAEPSEIRQYGWSPDSKWVAYTKPLKNRLSQVYLHSVEKKNKFPVTTDWFDSSSPVFSGDGKYLFFVSDRDFNPKISSTEWNHAYLEMSRIYLVSLSKDTVSPFRPRGDKEPDEPNMAKGMMGDEVEVEVDEEGLIDRTLQLPISVANYSNLSSVDDVVFYTRRSMKNPKNILCRYDLGTRKETELGEVGGYEISADGKKMLIGKGKAYYIISLPKSSLALKKSLDLSGMEVKLDLREEWRQIFHESWRQMRDFFYDPNLHGVDWKATRKKYEPLVAHVNHRADLTYVIGEMIGELNAGHCYVGGGDLPKVKRIPQGLLGARFARDKKTKYYKITKILKGANWSKALRSPLTEIGVNVKEGEYILAVNGQPTNEMNNIYESLVNTAGKSVRLKVNSQPQGKGSREVLVVPIDNEQELYYYNWVQTNIKKVAKATKGKVGNLNIPDKQVARGLNEFVKHFYPQLRKKALIIDVRGNGGGNVSPQIIERLRRKLAMMKVARNTSFSPDPFPTLYGPMVCLLDEFSASDGDLFPYRFKKQKLGKLIGKRSWGGVIGIRGPLPMLDGGQLFKPEFATYGADGKEWIIEGRGVTPDIPVDNDPGKEYAGIDEQLNRAIEVILDELRTGEQKLKAPPPFPKR